MKPHLLACAVAVAVALVCGLSACHAISSQSVYEGLRTQEKIKSADSPTRGNEKSLPPYDAYEKERSVLKPSIER